MESKILSQLRKELRLATHKMTPAQRLLAFVAHSENVALFHRAGRLAREQASLKNLQQNEK